MSKLWQIVAGWRARGPLCHEGGGERAQKSSFPTGDLSVPINTQARARAHRRQQANRGTRTEQKPMGSAMMTMVATMIEVRASGNAGSGRGCFVASSRARAPQMKSGARVGAAAYWPGASLVGASRRSLLAYCTGGAGRHSLAGAGTGNWSPLDISIRVQEDS